MFAVAEVDLFVDFRHSVFQRNLAIGRNGYKHVLSAGAIHLVYTVFVGGDDVDSVADNDSLPRRAVDSDPAHKVASAFGLYNLRLGR